MGIVRDFINDKVIGSEVRETIKTAKGQENAKEITCDFCGKTKDKIVAKCQYIGSGSWPRQACMTKSFSGIINSSVGISSTKLCRACSVKCKECGKYFCPEHIKKHNCV